MAARSHQTAEAAKRRGTLVGLGDASIDNFSEDIYATDEEEEEPSVENKSVKSKKVGFLIDVLEELNSS
tara:strand:+ start:93 stop:299 length:207 start_codon:yes stop_codon:yes gene_type:complete